MSAQLCKPFQKTPPAEEVPTRPHITSHHPTVSFSPASPPSHTHPTCSDLEFVNYNHMVSELAPQGVTRLRTNRFRELARWRVGGEWKVKQEGEEAQ